MTAVQRWAVAVSALSTERLCDCIDFAGVGVTAASPPQAALAGGVSDPPALLIYGYMKEGNTFVRNSGKINGGIKGTT